jgi:hypothetical protein
MVPADGEVHGQAQRDADRQPDEDSRVQRPAARAVGGGVLEVGGDLALEGIAGRFLRFGDGSLP